MKINRRRAIEFALLSSSCLLLPSALKKHLANASQQESVKFQLPLKIPPVLQPIRRDEEIDYYEILLKKAQQEIIPGFKTQVWGYNGVTPGPTIRQQAHRRSQVRLINQLGQDETGQDINAVVHLHGMPSNPEYDGYTTDFISPNYYKDYIYPNDRLGTLWYHDHVMDLTWRNVYMGMLGIYIVEDEFERSLPLPKGKYDVPLIIESKDFAPDGSLIFNDDNRVGMFPYYLTLVNGVPYPKLEVANCKYRFRILNGTAKSYYQLLLSRKENSLTPDEQLVVIGNDGGLIDRPIPLNSPETLRITMAERYEVIIDFSQYPIGTQLYLQNAGVEDSVSLDTEVFPIMRFDVVREVEDDSQIPVQLRPFQAISLKEASKHRAFIYDQDDDYWTINHNVWDVNRVDAQINPGDIEIWTFINPQDTKLHPIHLHFVEGQIIDRDGQPPRPYERGWKDVFDVGYGETVRVAFKFATREGRLQAGKYMMHCHHLQHEDRGMMSQFVIGEGNLDPSQIAPAKPFQRTS
jgi:FtsP/CotA-like multicopper oxidase with cupredoxin domain